MQNPTHEDPDRYEVRICTVATALLPELPKVRGPTLVVLAGESIEIKGKVWRGYSNVTLLAENPGLSP